MINPDGSESFICEDDLRDRCPDNERSIMLDAMQKSSKFKHLADAFVDGTDMYEFTTKDGNLPGREGYCIVKDRSVVLAHIFVTNKQS